MLICFGATKLVEVEEGVSIVLLNGSQKANLGRIEWVQREELITSNLEIFTTDSIFT